MKTPTTRNLWLDFFIRLGFTSIDHAPLIHNAFPRSFNMSAGLIQLDPRIRQKELVASGKEVLIQPCVRHFDIEKVGDESHLSFFEMAGAFEIVEYNKIITINNTWNFLTKELKIDPTKIWATVFNKDVVAGREIDLETELKDFVTKTAGEHVIFGNKETNLWEQGGGADLKDNIKLCGPQVEFFYDQGVTQNCQNPNCNPFCKCGRFLEISNILFIEHFIDYSKEPILGDLVNKSTEVVIGVERCAKIVESVSSIYLTSYLKPLVDLISPRGDLNENIKIIADHIKSLMFIMAEQKIEPGKKDRGRIIRTLIRGLLSSMYAEKLNPQELLPKLCQKVAQMYQEPYPYLNNGVKTCLEVIFAHEKDYIKTLEKGTKHIKEFIKEKGEQNLTEADYTFFWEKYGFPKKLLFIL